MQLRTIVPALAAVAAFPMAAQAFEFGPVKDWTFKVDPRVQVWFTTIDNDADDAQSWDLLVRRLRLPVSGKNADGWGFKVELNADKVSQGDGDPGNDPKFTDAHVTKSINSGDIKHQLKWGLEQIGDYGLVSVSDSSSTKLLPNGRGASLGEGNLGVGVMYAMSAPMFGIKLGIGESESKADAPDDDSDMYVAGRFSTSLSPDMALSKRMDSFLGKESDGIKHELGVAFEMAQVAGDATNTTFGVDYLLHYNQISALAEVYIGTEEATADGADDTDLMSVTAQAGYAVPLTDGVVEPALMIGMQTFDDGATDGTDTYMSVGVNYYFSGHKNKIQAAVETLSAENSDDDSTEFVIAYQLDF
ncbi:MAG: porin [Planctomycetota bacterium]